MKKLKELTYLISPNKIAQVELIGRSKKNDSKIDQLYKLICENKIETDEDAMRILYKNSTSKKGLYQVKDRLHKKLIDSLFLLELTGKKYSSTNSQLMQCFKACAALELLIRESADVNIIPLAEKTIKVCIRYELVGRTMRLAQILRRYYSLLHGDEKKFRLYSEIYDKFKEIRDGEELAELYWSKVQFYSAGRRVISDRDIIEEIKQYAKDLDKHLKRPYTTLVFVISCLLKLKVLELENNHEKIISQVDKFLPKLRNNKNNFSIYENAFLSKRFIAAISIRKLSKTEKAIEGSLQSVKKGIPIWFKLKEAAFILQLYNSNYQNAFELYKEVVTCKRFAYLNNSIKEIWVIYRAYLQFFINIGEIKLSKKEKAAFKFRYKKFLNEVPIYSKDKTGMNITIKIAQFLILLSEEKSLDLLDWKESVKKYTQLHLRNETSHRANCFINLLIKIIEGNYDKASVRRKTKDLYQNFHKDSDFRLKQSCQIEIVPYENLWVLLLNLLK